ncbi:MAG TPA: GNAT family N-acetyltransferase [Acidobacteria bacterium]|nr:GNAT family N-acetyltransferase [Acidobacteriota bacterium]
MDDFDIPTLETDRLWLRRFRRGDLEAYTELCLDPEVRRGLAWSGPGSPLGASRHFACTYGEWWLAGFGVWAVEEKATAAFLGWIGFSEPPGWPGFELCWALHPRYWGRGFATEGARTALAHGFEALQRGHVISLILPDNHASQRLAGRLGMRQEGRTAETGVDLFIFGIDRPQSCR